MNSKIYDYDLKIKNQKNKKQSYIKYFNFYILYLKYFDNEKFNKKLAEHEVSKIFKSVGWSRSKRVSFLDFFSVNIDFKKSITEAHIQFVFSKIDLNQNEYIFYFQ